MTRDGRQIVEGARRRVEPGWCGGCEAGRRECAVRGEEHGSWDTAGGRGGMSDAPVVRGGWVMGAVGCGLDSGEEGKIAGRSSRRGKC